MTLLPKIVPALILAAPLFAIDPARAPEPLIAHEWGTFTSVAAEDGRSVAWSPLSGPADLPCFVARLTPYSPKQNLHAFVRMETPVLYFYSSRPVTLSVRIGFPQGRITEWYPQATKVAPSSPDWSSGHRNGQIEWSSVEVLPGAQPELPSTKAPSHYYAARDTDAAPLRIGNQWEKLIFYRGIGDFDVPLRPVFTREGRLKIQIAGSEAVPLAILFEYRSGKVGYRIARRPQQVTELDPPELTANLEDLRRDLVENLVEFGLYRKEATAMVETWRDSWFEEGMRLFYIVPRSLVDSLLPLSITPAPTSTARVFVGRIEILSPAVRQVIETALLRGDAPELKKFGRFLESFAAQIARTSSRSVEPSSLPPASRAVLRPRFGGPACVE
jgi:hypothetical protein